MDEERRIEGFQVEYYTTRRNTEIKAQRPVLSKEWRDWLIAECRTICEQMYISEMREFLNIGEKDEDLSQEIFEGIKLTTFRFDPKKIPYVPVKMKRKAIQVHANLNDDIYHTKRFTRFIHETLVLQKGKRKLKAKFKENYEPYLAGLKEWLRRQFLSAFRQYITWSKAENQARQNKARADMGAYSSDISVKQFQQGEANSSSWITTDEDEETTDRLKAIVRLVNGDEELLNLMIDKYSKSSSGNPHREETVFSNFKRRRLKEVMEKYDLTEKQALANASKYRLTEQKLINDYQKLIYRAEDIFTELKEDYS